MLVCLHACSCLHTYWACTYTYLHPATHSSSLCLCDSTMVVAVLSLLGRWGWGDALEESVWCVAARRPIPQWCFSFSFRDSAVANRGPRRGRSPGDPAFNPLLGKGSTSIYTGPNLTHWSDVPITWKGRQKWVIEINQNRKHDTAS